MISWLSEPDRELLAGLSLGCGVLALGCGVLATILTGLVWAVVAAIRWGLS